MPPDETSRAGTPNARQPVSTSEPMFRHFFKLRNATTNVLPRMWQSAARQLILPAKRQYRPKHLRPKKVPPWRSVLVGTEASQGGQARQLDCHDTIRASRLDFLFCPQLFAILGIWLPSLPNYSLLTTSGRRIRIRHFAFHAVLHSA